MTAAIELPSPDDVTMARNAASALAMSLREATGGSIRVRADGAGGSSVVVPRHAFELFLEVLDQMAHGNAVTLVPVHAELTTQQAAELLNVSRPYVIKLLESGRLPFHKVGTHRRIPAAALFAYKRQQAARAEETMAELARLSQELELE